MEAAISLHRAPGPRGVPLFGSTLEAWKDPLALMLRAMREHGDIVGLRFGPFDYLMLNDSDAIHHVLVENYKNYTKGRNYEGLKLVLGQGLVTSEGEHWRKQRKLAQPAFHRDRLAGFAEIMARATAGFVEQWASKDGQVVDVHEEMVRLTFLIVGLTLFSVDLGGEADRVGPLVADAVRYANDYAMALIRIPPWVPTAKNRHFRRIKGSLDKLVYRMIQERREAGASATQDDLLAMLMSATDADSGAAMSDEELRDEAMTIVLAGHETTANLLAFTWHLLSLHPDVARRVRAEAIEVLGDRAPGVSDLPRLELTTRVLQEVMRIYPPAWGFERQAIEADQAGGYRIEKGTIVGILPYVLHRNPRHWPNPESFDPDRFLPERSAERPRYAYLPFGGGPRQCIGNAFAMMEAQIVLAMIARRYRLENVAGHPFALDPTVTLRPRHGIRATIRAEPPASG